MLSHPITLISYIILPSIAPVLSYPKLFYLSNIILSYPTHISLQPSSYFHLQPLYSISYHRWGEGSILLGIIALTAFTILGIVSLPSVAARMSWKEWSFIQSVIGYFGLACTGIHAFLLLVTSLCRDRNQECSKFDPLDPQETLKGWIGVVPTRTYLHFSFSCTFSFFYFPFFLLPSFLPSFLLLAIFFSPSDFQLATFLFPSIPAPLPDFLPLHQCSPFPLHSILIPLLSPLILSFITLFSYLISSSPISVGWIVIGFPILVIGAKILLLLPPISWRLAGIRKGEVYGAVYACRTVRKCCKNNRMGHLTESDMKIDNYHSEVEEKTMN